MAENQNICTGRHCTFALHAQLVFVTKYRHKVFKDTHLTRMEEIMRAVCADFVCELIEFDGENNHVHLLVPVLPARGCRRCLMRIVPFLRNAGREPGGCGGPV
ncbi:IS200/IS605 family transposase [Streptomyces sp. 4503]|uniref:IS200/IS605 family transposase n=1 Tax=Streptomyces niphimycinicus TaxID=2842201 RepID=A0ABS6C772_9ACTN|nr:IS200/IS605 family transposase [Streptomyces niphimycinicus]